MTAYESRPAEAAPETPAKKSETSLPPGWPYDTDVDPLSLNASERAIYYSGFSRGLDEGLIRGRREGWQAHVEREQRAWEHMRDSVRVPFANVRYSQLCELRGDREAAHYARIRERLLGLSDAS